MTKPVTDPTPVETQQQRDEPFQKRMSAMLDAENKARVKQVQASRERLIHEKTRAHRDHK